MSIPRGIDKSSEDPQPDIKEEPPDPELEPCDQAESASIKTEIKEELPEGFLYCQFCCKQVDNKMYLSHILMLHRSVEISVCPFCLWQNPGVLMDHLAQCPVYCNLQIAAQQQGNDSPKQGQRPGGEVAASLPNLRNEAACARMPLQGVCCDECGQEFPSYPLYAAHFQLSGCQRHQQRPDGLFPCQYCDAVLGTLAGVKNHISYTHKDQACYRGTVCDICHYRAGTTSSLVLHIEQKHMDKAKRFYHCQDCTFQALTATALSIHKVMAHSNGEQKTSMVQIKRKAPPKTGTAKQLRDNEGEGKQQLSLYNCSHCQCTCWGTIQLANHMQRVHGIIDPMAAYRSPINSAVGGKLAPSTETGVSSGKTTLRSPERKKLAGSLSPASSHTANASPDKPPYNSATNRTESSPGMGDAKVSTSPSGGGGQRRDKVHQCVICGERLRVNTPDAVGVHLAKHRLEVGGRLAFRCPHCNVAMLKLKKLLEHIDETHQDVAVDLSTKAAARTAAAAKPQVTAPVMNSSDELSEGYVLPVPVVCPDESDNRPVDLSRTCPGAAGETVKETRTQVNGITALPVVSSRGADKAPSASDRVTAGASSVAVPSLNQDERHVDASGEAADLSGHLAEVAGAGTELPTKSDKKPRNKADVQSDQSGSDTSADSGDEEGDEGQTLDNFVHILDNRGKTVRQYVCQFCSAFKTRKRLSYYTHIQSLWGLRDAHLMSQDRPAVECQHCPFKRTDVAQLDTHVKTTHPKQLLRCWVERCCFSTGLHTIMKHHLLYEHNISNGGNNHNRAHSNSTPSGSPGAESKKWPPGVQPWPGRVRCKICTLALSSERVLASHLFAKHNKFVPPDQLKEYNLCR